MRMNPEIPSDGLPMNRVPGRTCKENWRENRKKKSLSKWDNAENRGNVLWVEVLQLLGQKEEWKGLSITVGSSRGALRSPWHMTAFFRFSVESLAVTKKGGWQELARLWERGKHSQWCCCKTKGFAGEEKKRSFYLFTKWYQDMLARDRWFRQVLVGRGWPTTEADDSK